MWKTGESVEEQIETGVIILVSAVALVQVPLIIMKELYFGWLMAIGHSNI